MKVTKKQVSSYRRWSKLSLVLAKLLSFCNARKGELEEEMFKVVVEKGPVIVDGCVIETQVCIGRRSVSYKDAYLYALELMNEKNRRAAGVFLESITKEPGSTVVLRVSDAQVVAFGLEVKAWDCTEQMDHLDYLLGE